GRAASGTGRLAGGAACQAQSKLPQPSPGEQREEGAILDGADERPPAGGTGAEVGEVGQLDRAAEPEPAEQRREREGRGARAEGAPLAPRPSLTEEEGDEGEHPGKVPGLHDGVQEEREAEQEGHTA